jgi:DinB superfamily
MDPATLQALEAFPDQLETLYRSIPATRARWTPPSWDGIPSETFNAIGQICHIRDIEVDGYQVRLRRLITEADPTLPSLDSYALAIERNYDAADAEEVLASFRHARTATAAAVAALTETQLARRGTFEGYGPVTVEALIHYLSSHDQQHIAGLQWLIGKMKSDGERPKE